MCYFSYMLYTNMYYNGYCITGKFGRRKVGNEWWFARLKSAKSFVQLKQICQMFFSPNSYHGKFAPAKLSCTLVSIILFIGYYMYTV